MNNGRIKINIPNLRKFSYRVQTVLDILFDISVLDNVLLMPRTEMFRLIRPGSSERIFGISPPCKA